MKSGQFGLSLEAHKRPKYNPSSAQIRAAIARFEARGGKIERLPDFTPLNESKLASMMGAGAVFPGDER